MHDTKSNVKTIEVLAAKSRAANTYKSDGIDMSGFGSATFLVSAGTFAAGATLDAKLQHSDTDVDGNYADVTADDYNDGAITQLAAAGRARLHYTKKLKRYVRVVAVTAVGAVECGVTGVLGGANHLPVSYGASE